MLVRDSFKAWTISQNAEICIWVLGQWQIWFVPRPCLPPGHNAIWIRLCSSEWIEFRTICTYTRNHQLLLPQSGLEQASVKNAYTRDERVCGGIFKIYNEQLCYRYFQKKVIGFLKLFQTLQYEFENSLNIIPFFLMSSFTPCNHEASNFWNLNILMIFFHLWCQAAIPCFIVWKYHCEKFSIYCETFPILGLGKSNWSHRGSCFGQLWSIFTQCGTFPKTIFWFKNIQTYQLSLLFLVDCPGVNGF